MAILISLRVTQERINLLNPPHPICSMGFVQKANRNPLRPYRPSKLCCRVDSGLNMYALS